MRKVFAFGLAGYKKEYLKKDIIASLVVASISIPESLGFAVIAGLPLEAGLYTAIFAPIAYAMFAKSKRLIVGADSATAAIVAAGAGLVAAAGTEGYLGAVTLLGVLVAGILFIMSIARLGFLASLVSRPVLIGLLAGIGLQLMVGKFPEMIGGNHQSSLLATVTSLPGIFSSLNWLSVTISVLVLGTILLSRKSRIPGELIGLVGAILFAVVFKVGEYDVKLVGALPSGLPQFAFPLLSLDAALTLIPAALAIAFVILAQSSAVIKSSAEQHDEKIDINKDLFALGVANLASAFGKGFVANGSPPRTIAADIAGGRSQMVNIFAAVVVMIVVLFGSRVFDYVPESALAAIVFGIGLHLFRLNELKYLWKVHRTEFFVAMVALIAVALLGVRQGILIAVIVALMERLSRQYRPNDQILLRDGELSEWAEKRVGHHAHHDPNPKGLLIYSFESSLFFENVDYFVARLKKAIAGAREPVNYVVVDAGVTESVDYTAVEALKHLYRYFSTEDIELAFAHVSPHLRQQFDDYGVTELVGSQNIYPTLNAAILSHPESRRSSEDMIKRLGLRRGSYVVIGGAVLEALNLRKTKDVDMVVDDEVYNYYRDHKKWKEYVQDNGKKILSKDGYNLMHSWIGYRLKALRRESFERNGVDYMGISQLISAKTHLGRKKDIRDIKLLRAYQDDHRKKQVQPE